MKNNKKAGIAVVVVALLTYYSAVSGNCAEVQETNTAVEHWEVTFTDDLGREIKVEHPQRVAALLGSFADMWYLAGGEIAASADDAWEDFDLPLTDEVVNLGMTKELSLEKLFAADPDFVLASTNTKQHMEWLEILEQAGITTAYFDVADFEDYLNTMDIFTDITGRKDLYQKNGEAIQGQIQEIIKESQRHIEERKEAPSVLILRASSSWIRAKNSQNHVLGEMLAALGCENIADSDEVLLENLSMEHIMTVDPDHIFICQVGDDQEKALENMEIFIAENPAWGSLTAVKKGRVHHMEKELYTLKPNDRWAEAYERVEEILFHE